MARLPDLLAWNESLCRRVDERWARSELNRYWNDYARTVAALAQTTQRATVVDVGAGRETPFARYLSDPAAVSVVGVDVLGADMEQNRALDQRIVRDVAAEGLPPSVAPDVVSSRMLLEHLPDTEAFVRNVYEALKPGGATVHMFAARFSAFALANRLLPNRLARWLLFRLRPESVDHGGFRVYYDRTYASAVRRAFHRAGFEAVELRVNYEVAQYARFFVPLYVLALAWERVLTALDWQNAAAFVTVVARKPG